LDAIREFQAIVDEDAQERVLQKYLFYHLWLLDPAWERATESALMETRLIEEGILTEDLTEKESSVAWTSPIVRMLGNTLSWS